MYVLASVSICTGKCVNRPLVFCVCENLCTISIQAREQAIYTNVAMHGVLYTELNEASLECESLDKITGSVYFVQGFCIYR